MKYPLLTGRYSPSIAAFVFTVIIALCHPCFAQETETEETYSISLVQTAEVDKEIHEIEGRKVLSESYTVKKGDHVWNILREKGLLEKKNLIEILAILKKLNSSLTNLDLIHPGERIIIPLVITPLEGAPALTETTPPVTISLEDIKDVDLEYYTIKPGDSLIKVVKGLYDISDRELHDEYLGLLKRINPSIRDLDTVYPGQKVRLPIYSPDVVRQPIKPVSPVTEPRAETRVESLEQLGDQLKELFTLLGEEWVQTGKHFIPLKTGGQINLSAESYPIIDLRSGNRIIVDIYNDLPEQMARLITTSWDNYKIIHLERGDDLKSAIQKIIGLCDYNKVFGADEPLILGGDIPIRITADWIIQLPPETPSQEENIIVLNLLNDGVSRTPATIRTYLKGLGIKAIDYPPVPETMGKSPEETTVLETVDDASSIVEMLLNLMGLPFSSKVEIPIYQSDKTDFNLIVKADFFLNINGRDSIIDLSGLGQDIINLLNEHRFLVLSIADGESPIGVITKSLEFLGVESDSKPHPFLAADRDELKNIRLMIPGLVFRDKEYRTIFATGIRLSPEITAFLAQKGYIIWHLPVS